MIASGLWPSRDPIEEVGGRNLYAFAANRPTDFIDAFGQEYSPWPGHPPLEFTPPTSPGPIDQFNPFGIFGSEETVDYTGYFDSRFPKTMDAARATLQSRIKKKVCALSDSAPSTIPGLLGGADDYDVTQTNGRILDSPETWYERNVRIGDFEVKADDIRLTNWTQGQCARCFDYDATIFVLEQTGTARGEREGFLSPLFRKRYVRMGEWHITGSHCCDKMP